MRRTTVIVLVAAELTLMLRCLEYLSCCHISDSFVWSAAGLLPDYIGGDRDSVITGNLVLLKSAKVRKRISLDVLTGEQGQNVSCPPNTKPIFNNPGINVNASSSYKIPFVIHQTFKSRCVSDEFYQLTLAWKGLGIPYYFHDDAAIERLAQSHFKEFPLLQLIWDHCITKPVVKTDLWRLLLLYEYGGIYADLDTKPVSFQPSTTFRMEDEMYTVPDQVGLPSFHFIASMPRHPVSFLTVQLALDALLYTPDTGSYNPAKKTGPGALRSAMELFVRNHDPNRTQSSQIMGDNFTFHGMGGHTLRRDRRTRNEIVMECAIRNKENQFQSNNVTHYSRTMASTGESCSALITKYYEQLN